MRLDESILRTPTDPLSVGESGSKGPSLEVDDCMAIANDFRMPYLFDL
jgi:hypothetical protein